MKYAHCFLVKCKSPNISVQFIHIICIYIYRDYHHHHHHPEVFEYGIFKNIPNFAGMVSIFYLLQDEISISFISIYSFSQVSHHDGYTPRWFRLCAWQPLGTAPVAGPRLPPVQPEDIGGDKPGLRNPAPCRVTDTIGIPE